MIFQKSILNLEKNYNYWRFTSSSFHWFLRFEKIVLLQDSKSKKGNNFVQNVQVAFDGNHQ